MNSHQITEQKTTPRNLSGTACPEIVLHMMTSVYVFSSLEKLKKNVAVYKHLKHLHRDSVNNQH